MAPDGWGGGSQNAEQENAERKAWLDSLTEEEYEKLQQHGDAVLQRAAKAASTGKRKPA
jgi:hypothetical protein